jgi:hypothetical protein
MCEECEADPLYPMVKEFLEKWPDAAYGPAHVVLADMNTEPELMRWCLHLTEGCLWMLDYGFVANSKRLRRMTKHKREELVATRDVLRKMLGEPEPVTVDISQVRLELEKP